MEITFNIPVQSINEVHKHLIKLQKRARKLQVPLTFGFDDEVKTHRFDAHTEQGDVIASYKYRVLRVNQDITVHEGWVPIAKVDVAEKQLRSYAVYNKEVESLGDSLWTKHCDHCGHNKIVHTAFVMQNGDKFMKVGKGCMRELAPASAIRIAKEFDIYSLWSDYLAMMTAPEDMGGAGGFGGGRGFGSGVAVDLVYDKSLLILAMRAGLEKSGGEWVTSQYSEGDRYGRGATMINRGSRTFDYIQGFLTRNHIKELCLIPDAKYVDSVNAQINLCLEKYHEQLGELLDEFKVFASADKARAIDVFLIRKALGIIERERKKDLMRVSEFQGAIGTKMPLTLEYVSERSGQGTYGTWTLTIFKDQNGNMFKKFGSVPDRFKNEDGLYQFTAPVKAHETYQDIKYTVLGGPLSKFKK